MANLVNLSSKSDVVGAIASILCFLHCLAAPFLFVVQAGLVTGEGSHPWWWGTLDMGFLAISLLAVYWSAKKTTKGWVKVGFWGLWGVLALIILNEKMGIVHLTEQVIYLPTLGLVFLHFYNRQYCHCKDENCCVEG